MSKDRREIVIENIETNRKHYGILKKAYSESLRTFQVYLISNIFDGSKCSSYDRELFYYSWILTGRGKEKINKIDLDKMKELSQNDWDYSFPPEVINSSYHELGTKQIYKIYFKNEKKFKEINL